MPKILQINSNVNSGGAGRIVEQIGVQASRNGWQSYIAYGRRGNKSESETIKIGGQLDVYLHGLKSMLFDKHGFGSKTATKDLIKKIYEIDPDVIHLHGIHGYYLNIEILFTYLKKSNKPIVWTMHDCWAITGHCSHFSDIECMKWKTGCFECPKFKNYPTSLVIDNSKNNYKIKKKFFTSFDNLTIVSVSSWLNNIMSSSYLSKYYLVTILNGVDVSVFSNSSNGTNRIRSNYGIGSRFMLLGVATSWGVGKGLNDYIKLSQILSDDFSIVLVGLTKKQMNKIPKNIIGVERTESVDELAAFYSAADVVLNLSNQETFGLTTVEGFACGTPGIVYNCTASPELISDDTGLIVEQGDMEQLINAIRLIKLNGKEYYSANCRKRAKLVYDKEKRYGEYIELYNLLLKKQQIM